MTGATAGPGQGATGAATVPRMSDEILEVDLLAFESGDADARKAVVDGVMRSLATGFVYVGHDVSEDLIDTAYELLERFFTLPAETKAQSVAPGTHGQTGYTGLLVETAATADVADWKEMLNWARDVPLGHPLRTRYPHRYHDQVLPEAAVPGITEVLNTFHDAIFDLQRRILRIIAVGIGAHEAYFEKMLVDGSTLSRAIHYPPMDSAPDAPHVWAGEHADINLITALPRATAAGLQVKLKDEGRWIDAVAPEGRAIINTGLMLEVITNGVIAPGASTSDLRPRAIIRNPVTILRTGMKPSRNWRYKPVPRIMTIIGTPQTIPFSVVKNSFK